MLPAAQPPIFMSDEELRTVTVEASAVAERLPEVLQEHGLAVVVGVLDSSECCAAVKAFWEDVGSLVREEESPHAAWPAGKLLPFCHGVTKTGARCSINAKTQGCGRRHRDSLMAGNAFCQLHLHQNENVLELARGADEWAKQECGGAIELSAEELERARLCSKLHGTCLMNKRGMAHGKFSWFCRLHPRVRASFAAAYGDAQLSVSLDGALYTEKQQKPLKATAVWPHVDYNPLAGGSQPGYQGLLYITDCQAETSTTTALLRGSHQGPVADMMSFPASGARYVELISMERSAELLAAWRAGARRVPTPAGALLIWHERTAHQGCPGRDSRLVQPVAYEPRALVSEEARRRREWMLALGLPSTHSASAAQLHTAYGKRAHLETEAILRTPSKRLRVGSCARPFGLREGATIRDAWVTLLADGRPGTSSLEATGSAPLLSESVRAVL
jgi:ectoine hydroxylase-related dioxygenase (phytanoyl-CoA dioxygenase family)